MNCFHHLLSISLAPLRRGGMAGAVSKPSQPRPAAADRVADRAAADRLADPAASFGGGAADRSTYPAAPFAGAADRSADQAASFGGVADRSADPAASIATAVWTDE